MKERERLKQDLGNRKSLASQIRMKSIANLASDNPTKKRRRGGDDDDFGADDDDWGVYRQIAVGDNSDDEHEEEDLNSTLKSLEQDLLRYDPDFDYENTHEAQSDWSKSLLHAFARGPRPFDPSSQAELNQIHLNVERIRVPEVVFRPSIAGVDQSGIVEIAGDILNQRLGNIPNRDDFLRDVFLTGGNTLFKNFDDRVRDGLRALLPADSPLNVRRAGDALLDAWKGAAGWVGTPAWKTAKISREEYQEKGPEYIKVSYFRSNIDAPILLTAYYRNTTWVILMRRVYSDREIRSQKRVDSRTVDWDSLVYMLHQSMIIFLLQKNAHRTFGMLRSSWSTSSCC